MEVPSEATSVQVTALGGGLLASTSASVSKSASPVRMDPLQLARGGSCSSSWLPTFGGHPGVDGPVNAMTVYDGSGPALVLGGAFSLAGG